jgi:hypothetical protein
MAKNIYFFLQFSSQIKGGSGAVVEALAADPKEVGSPPACAF